MFLSTKISTPNLNLECSRFDIFFFFSSCLLPNQVESNVDREAGKAKDEYFLAKYILLQAQHVIQLSQAAKYLSASSDKPRFFFYYLCANSVFASQQ